MLIMSIGGNDCGFAGTLNDMVTGRHMIGWIWDVGLNEQQVKAKAEKAIAAMPALYAKLNTEIRAKLNPKVILIPEYPTPMFDGDNGKPARGCGIFDQPGTAGVTVRDAGIIEDVGNKLNKAVRTAAAKHGWIVVTGIADDFSGHGYCSTQPFYVGAEESCNRQDDLEGTMHPNRNGTMAAARRLGTELTNQLNTLDADQTAGVRRAPRKPAPSRGITVTVTPAGGRRVRAVIPGRGNN